MSEEDEEVKKMKNGKKVIVCDVLPVAMFCQHCCSDDEATLLL